MESNEIIDAQGECMKADCVIISGIQQTKYQSVLIIHKGLKFQFTNKKPNFWFRFWHKIFFGFKWEGCE